MEQYKILQPKEGVTLLAVLWPEEASELCMPKIGMVDLYFQNKNGIDEEYISVNIPLGPWKLLGIATEIPEEVWQGIMPGRVEFLPPLTDNPKELVRTVVISATESAMSFLETNDVYSVNPYGEKPKSSGEYHGKGYREWQQAEANTGTWVILMKQND